MNLNSLILPPKKDNAVNLEMIFLLINEKLEISRCKNKHRILHFNISPCTTMDIQINSAYFHYRHRFTKDHIT